MTTRASCRAKPITTRAQVFCEYHGENEKFHETIPGAQEEFSDKKVFKISWHCPFKGSAISMDAAVTNTVHKMINPNNGDLKLCFREPSKRSCMLYFFQLKCCYKSAYAVEAIRQLLNCLLICTS